ncbi:Pimeloyl-ACP methyl ester carboxylesterase [Streptomyces sp. DvalAA-14]|uniref:alpha/beta fold hydrolase n=1 Tax=unclassified Streptomyces TaxID=2593676 RepID=UPI00081B3E7D|nr:MULTISPECIES: alpha/beta hydrolase [unclassified Streptomyces]MYS23716.1 alpha/beta fold hydrolase [Streptomyces sp. SID4948]SCE37684.1 Pimeloyl-ACP methyl ester carboxylesterase [Streptomyces sp. DvalAA-14]
MPASDATEHSVSTPHGRISAVDHAGEEPAFVLLHGYPDDSHGYEKLVPELRPRRVVTVDFLGYGDSERSQTRPMDAGQRTAETAAVMDQMGIGQAVLVGHDGGGPVAVDYTRQNPDRVAKLALMNCYYGHSDTLTFPDLIQLFSDAPLADLTDGLLGDPAQALWLLAHTAAQLGYDVSEEILTRAVQPQFFGSSEQTDALAAIRAWTARIPMDLDAQDQVISDGGLAAVRTPVEVVFGAQDHYLDPDVARHLAGLFPDARLTLVEGARHWVQSDRSQEVASVLREAA